MAKSKKDLEMKKLLDEVREIKDELDLLKLGPSIATTVKKTASKEISKDGNYTVTYTVYQKSYAVLV